MTDTLTCVFYINDKDEFKKERDRLNSNFKELDGQPWAITSMSVGDEIKRLELLEEAHDAGLNHLFEKIFGLVDPSAVEDVHKLLEDS